MPTETLVLIPVVALALALGALFLPPRWRASGALLGASIATIATTTMFATNGQPTPELEIFHPRVGVSRIETAHGLECAAPDRPTGAEESRRVACGSLVDIVVEEVAPTRDEVARPRIPVIRAEHR